MAEPYNLVYLPDHILIQIFSFMSYSEISRMREVCQTFNRICSRELTKAFVRVDRLHSQIQKNIKSQLPRKESERRNHALSRFVDVLSALETRLSLLSMTYTKYIDLELCCFIPGMVLDELYQLLHRLQNTESQPPRPYDLLQSLRDLSTMAMEHFEEFIVPMLKAQMNERSQSLLFHPSTSSSISLLDTSLGPGEAMSSPLDVSAMSMMDCSWPMPLNVVSSPWRRTPLKQDVQRMQSQMQLHSAAIATMTKEYREQKVKIGEQNRIIAEQDRHLQEHRRLIMELKGHVQAQEKNLETMAAYVATVIGKEVHLPETKTWDHTLWDSSPKASTSSQDSSYASEMAISPDVVDRRGQLKQTTAEYETEADMMRDVKLRVALSQRSEEWTCHVPHARHTPSSTVTSEDAASLEQFMFQASESHQSLSSKCPIKRLLAHVALRLQCVAADHSLPVCLEEVSRTKTSDPVDPKNDLPAMLAAVQRQLSTLNEEHVGCSVCVAEDLMSLSPYLQRSESRNDPGSPAIQSVTNQGLVNRAQELYNRLNSLTQDKPSSKPSASSVIEGTNTEPARDIGRGKALKRKQSVTKGDGDKDVSGISSRKLRKCRKRTVESLD